MTDMSDYKKSFDLTLGAKEDACNCIDVTYVEIEEKKLCTTLNASNILGAVAFLIMVVAIPAAVEGEMYITAAVLTAVMASCAYLSMKEDGKIK